MFHSCGNILFEMHLKIRQNPSLKKSVRRYPPTTRGFVVIETPEYTSFYPKKASPFLQL
jgi:hypothetical protein